MPVALAVVSLLASQMACGGAVVAAQLHAGINEVSGSLGTERVQVQLTAVLLSPMVELGDRVVPGQVPDRVLFVREIKLRVGSKTLFVPRSAFLDLVWVREASIRSSGSIAVLVLKGGDGSESFTTEIEFGADAVTKRSDYSGGQLDQPLQVTRYFQRIVW